MTTPAIDDRTRRARELWIAAGSPPGGPDLFLDQAEKEIGAAAYDSRDAARGDLADLGTAGAPAGHVKPT